MRKVLGIILLVLTLGIGMTLIIIDNEGIRYSDAIVTESECEEVEATRTETDGLVEGIIFNEERLIFDKSSNTYYYSLIDGDNNAYDPVIHIESGKKLRVAVDTQIISDSLIAANGTIQMVAYSDDEYERFNLKCTTLPTMSIECDDMNCEEDTDINISVFDNRENAINRVTSSAATMHIRGDSTRAYVKKGYRINLKTESLGKHTRSNELSFLGMRKDDDWLLYAAYNDQEKIRNVFTINLWADTVSTDNAYGVETGMRYKFVESFVNGEYYGIYALGYPVDEKVVGFDGNTDRNAVYKKVFWDNEKRITYPGGYELKSETTDDTQTEIINDINYELLYRYYFNLTSHAEDTEYLEKGIDINNAIDFMLYNNMIQGRDNLRGRDIRNMYLALSDKGDAIQCLYCPWDMDLTWGNQFTGDETVNCVVPYYYKPEQNWIMESGYVNQMIVNDDSDIIDRIVGKYRSLRQNEWSNDNIMSMIDEYEDEIWGSGAIYREMERWPDGTYSDPSVGLDTFRAYVTSRLQECDEYYVRYESAKDDSIYIQRSMQYKDFLNNDFDLVLGDKSVLSDQNYIDFFEYMGLDIDRITDSVKHITFNPAENIYNYVEETSEEATYGNQLTFYQNGDLVDYDFSTDFVCSPRLYNYRNLRCYIEEMKKVDKPVFIRFGAVSWANGSSAQETLSSLGIDGVTDTTNAMIYNFYMNEGIILDSFEINANYADTDYGTLAYYDTEEGVFGYYLDGKAVTEGEKSTADYYIDCVVLD